MNNPNSSGMLKGGKNILEMPCQEIGLSVPYFKDIETLQKENRLDSIPLGFLRGLNWNAKCIVADEAQNMTVKEITTLITRVGEFSKVFVLGDPDQSDINGKSGFMKIMNAFDDVESKENGIYTFKFTEEDIVRSSLVKYIVKKLKNVKPQ